MQVPSLDYPIAAKSFVRAVSLAGRRPSELSDGYPHVVVMLDRKTRVVAADIQWILQRRAGRAWQNQYFFRSKAGLLFYAPPAPELLALPDWFPA
jgi:hypothetical protein